MKRGGDGEESVISDLESGEWQEVDGSESRQKMKWWHGQLSHLHRRAVSPANQSLSEKAASYWVSLGRQHAGRHAHTSTQIKIRTQIISRHCQISPALCYCLISKRGLKKGNTIQIYFYVPCLQQWSMTQGYSCQQEEGGHFCVAQKQSGRVGRGREWLL